MRNFGEMKHKIIFQRKLQNVDSSGYEQPEEWKDFVTVRACKEDVGGREYYSAAAVQLEKTTVFTIWHRNDITNDMRIKYKAQFYNIIQINEGRGIGDIMTVRAKREEKEPN